MVDDEYNITGIIDWELAIVTSKGAAFQSPLLTYHLGELYRQGLSTPSEEETRFARCLREKGPNELAGLAVKKLHFRVEMIIDTDPCERDNFVGLFGGWWKASNGAEDFDWDVWRKEALEKYGNMPSK